MSKFFDLLLPWPWGEINWITDSFISVIIVTFTILVAIFLWKTIRRSRLIDGLSKEVSKYNRPAQPSVMHNLKVVFERNQLAESWQDFEDSLITRPRDENQKVVYKTDEASFFFGEDRLLDQHLNLRFWNSVPALLVGFGILGTFIGLVWGLIPFGGIDFANTTIIGNAIKILLSGVSTAFVTSVWGMLTSLLFNGLEKWRIGRASQGIANLQRALNQLFTLTTQEEISLRQEDEIAQQTAALKSVSTDFAIAIGGQLAPSFGKLEAAVQDIKEEMKQGQSGIIEKLDKAPNAIDEKLAPKFNALNTAVTRIGDVVLEGQKEIIQKLDDTPEALSNAIREQLEPSLEKLNETVEKLREEKEASSIGAIEELVKEFQNSLSGTAMDQIEKLAETVGEASESLKDLPRQISKMIESVQEQIDNTRKLLGEKSEEQGKEMEKTFQEMLEALKEAHQGTINTQSKTTETVNQEMRTIVADIRNLLKLAGDRTNEQLDKRLAEMARVSDQSIKTLEATITQLKDALDSSTSQASTESSEMIKRMREQVDLAAGRLEDIFKSGEECINSLLQLQGGQIKTINAQIANSRETLTKGREMLEQMGTSVENVHKLIDTTKDLSGQLTTGADQLKDAGRNLTRASEEFNQEHQKYLAANRETIAQIQDALSRSEQSLNDLAQRFQTIDDGLQSIFSEIQSGLTNYSTTTRDSINEYLSAFPTQLSNAATRTSWKCRSIRGKC